VHVQELRTAIGQVYTAAGKLVPAWTDTLATNATKIRAIHITELRQAVDNAPPPCTCTAWVNGSCGAGGCSASQRQQTRTCTPTNCAAQSQCVTDSSCQGTWDCGPFGVGY